MPLGPRLQVWLDPINGCFKVPWRAFAPLGIPLAWLQLTLSPGRFLAALIGAGFSVMLMIFQISTYGALLKSKVLRPINGIHADLIVVSKNSTNLQISESFPRNRLYQAASLPEAADVAPLYFGWGVMKNPKTLFRFNVAVFGVDPSHPVFTFPGIREHEAVLRQEDGFLFDGNSPGYFGPIREAFDAHRRVQVELEGKRALILGLFTMGPTLASEAHLIAGTQAFFRVFPDQNAGAVSLLAVLLKTGADSARAAARLRALLPGDVDVFTKRGYAEREAHFWSKRSPMSFVIWAMMVVSMLTGAVVVYQILFTDVNEHLAEYATLKAIGLTDQFLKRLVLVEAAILHLLGFGLGCLLTELAFLLVRARSDLPVRMDLATLGTVFLFTWGMCGIAGLMATRQLRLADPADTF
jgi:putative ABC transport system permease protein